MAQKLIEGSLVVHCKAEEMKQNIINVFCRTFERFCVSVFYRLRQNMLDGRASLYLSRQDLELAKKTIEEIMTQ